MSHMTETEESTTKRLQSQQQKDSRVNNKKTEESTTKSHATRFAVCRAPTPSAGSGIIVFIPGLSVIGTR